MKFSAKTVIKLISYWPPFLASGIKVISVTPDTSHIRVRLRTRVWNKNYYGTHFGGSLFSMCDPFYLFMLSQKLSKDHITWDKHTYIEFIKATSQDVFADFYVTDEDIVNIKEEALRTFSFVKNFETTVSTAQGDLVARVKKGVYIRRKDAKERFKTSQ